MKKSALILGLVATTIVVSLVIFLKSKSPKTDPTSTEEVVQDLPINVLPLGERPFITLVPDATGRSLNFIVDQVDPIGELEYELVYQSVEKQEGVFGRLNLSNEKQPIVKSLLLGSKSGGGKITYHEGVTGGSLTVTYGENRLKESWNFLTFDPADPVLSATDARFHVTVPAKAYKKGERVVTMKTFGYVKAGLPALPAKLVAGPYAYFFATPIKGNATVEIKLPAGEHSNPTIYEYHQNTWKKLPTKLSGDSASAQSVGNVFVVIAD